MHSDQNISSEISWYTYIHWQHGPGSTVEYSIFHVVKCWMQSYYWLLQTLHDVFTINGNTANQNEIGKNITQTNLFITLFIITLFWTQYSLKMNLKNVCEQMHYPARAQCLESTFLPHKFLTQFFCIICTVYHVTFLQIINHGYPLIIPKDRSHHHPHWRNSLKFLRKGWAWVLPLHALLFRFRIKVMDPSLFQGHSLVHKIIRVNLIVSQEIPRNIKPALFWCSVNTLGPI